MYLMSNVGKMGGAAHPPPCPGLEPTLLTSFWHLFIYLEDLNGEKQNFPYAVLPNKLNLNGKYGYLRLYFD